MQPAKRGQVNKEEVTYFFLVKVTDKGAMQSEAASTKRQYDVNRLVRQEGGQCRLYSFRGAPFDFVSTITGITSAAAGRTVAEIDKGGFVKATLVSGIEMFGDPDEMDATIGAADAVRRAAAAAA
jgi:uncharacterized protein with GYD domain